MTSSSPRVAWKRFWCPRGESYQIDRDGFLANPDPRNFQNGHLLETAEALDAHGVVLLGEPGLGKTDCLRSSAPTDSVGADRSTICDLAAYTSDTGVILDVFQSTTVKEWLQGAHTLTLSLDSLDECRLRVGTLGLLVGRQIEQLPRARLRVRLVSRTASWIASCKQLEEALLRVFGQDHVRIVELVPLRRVDVAAAATAAGVDADRFLDAVVGRDVVALASRPVTLRFLLNAFSKDQALPASKADLYRDGLSRLAAERSDSRIDSGLSGDLAPQARLELAERIAAVMTFGGVQRVQARIGSPSPDGLMITDLVGGPEGSVPSVEAAAISEVLDTGLFTGVGADLVGFAHQSYQEYLAARYVLRKCSSSLEIEEYLQFDASGRLPPQSVGVAGWIAGSRADLWRKLVRTDPAALLEGAAAGFSAEERAAVAAALLAAFNAGDLADPWFMVRARYRHLACPRLHEVVGGVLRDPATNEIARVVALDIAAECHLRGLDGLMADFALDVNQPRAIRERAAHLAATSPTASIRERLRPFLTAPAAEDPDDDLRGEALIALWPTQLTAAELFAALSPPRRSHYVGSYAVTVSRRIIPKLADDDLLEALSWLARSEGTWPEFGAYSDIEHAIVERALARLDIPSLRSALATFLLTQLRRYDRESLKDAPSWPRPKRRQLLAALADEMVGPRDADLVIVHPVRLADREDIPWVVEQIDAAGSDEFKRRWAQILARLYDPSDGDQTDAVLQVAERWPLLAGEFGELTQFVVFGSAAEKAMRDRAARYRELLASMESSRRHEPEPTTWVDLERLLSPNAAQLLRAWGILCRELLDDPFTPPLQASVLWEQATDAQRRRVVELARRVMVEGDPDSSSWLAGGNRFYESMAGYHAIRLLYDEDRGWLAEMSHEVWKRWAPVVYAFWFNDPPSPADDAVLTVAYERVPDAVLDTIDLLLRASGNTNPEIQLRRAALIWDERIAQLVLRHAGSRIDSADALADLLAPLLERAHDGGRELAERLVRSDGIETAVAAGAALLGSSSDAGWAVVSSRMKDDPDYARRLFLRYARWSDLRETRLASRLTDEGLAEAFAWLLRLFPPAEDPRTQGVQTPRDQAANLRDGVLAALVARASPVAIEALAVLASESPANRWLNHQVAQARSNSLKLAWKPMSAEEVLRMGQRPLVAILTALPVEFLAVRAHLSDVKETTDAQSGVVWEVGNFAGWRVAVSQTGPYEHVAATRTNDAVRFLHPLVAMFVGVGGGLKDVQVGDVVAGESAYLYEAGKEVAAGDGTAVLPRAQGALSDARLVERARAVARNAAWHARIAGLVGAAPTAFSGKIVSGSKVLAAPDGPTIALVRQHYGDALVTEMEGHAFLHAAHQSACPALLIRGVSDLVGDKAERDAEGWQAVAARNAAAFAFEVLAQFDAKLLT